MILSQLDLKKFQVAVVPRHPERFDEVYEIMKKFGNPIKLSEIKDNEKWKMENGKWKLGDFVLIDKMGELVNLYKVADIVILGGSFVDNVGGHNPIEAAFFNKPIISGKYYFNQYALYNEVENIEICEIDKLKEKLKIAKPTRIKNIVNLEEIIKEIE